MRSTNDWRWRFLEYWPTESDVNFVGDCRLRRSYERTAGVPQLRTEPVFPQMAKFQLLVCREESGSKELIPVIEAITLLRQLLHSKMTPAIGPSAEMNFCNHYGTASGQKKEVSACQCPIRPMPSLMYCLWRRLVASIGGSVFSRSKALLNVLTHFVLPHPQKRSRGHCHPSSSSLSIDQDQHPRRRTGAQQYPARSGRRNCAGCLRSIAPVPVCSRHL